MSLLELKNVHTYYGHIHALKGISLTVEEGEIVTLIGSNGAGKTTTLRTISGLVKPRQGRSSSRAGPSTASPPTRSWPSGWGTSPRGGGSSPGSRWKRTWRSGPTWKTTAR